MAPFSQRKLHRVTNIIKKKNKKLGEKFQSSIVQFKNYHISKEKVIESTDLGTFPSILTA